MIHDDLKQEILDILAKQWRGGHDPEVFQRLTQMNQALLLGDDPLIQEPDDIRKGAVLKLISRAQMDRVLAPHTYGKIESAVDAHKKKIKAEAPKKKKSSGAPRKSKASVLIEGPKTQDVAEIRVSETGTMQVPMALVQAVGIRKQTVLAILGTLTTGWFSEEGLKSVANQGKLMASESSIKKVIRDYKANPAVCAGLQFRIREEEGTEEYCVAPD